MNKTVTITSMNHKYATTYGGNITELDFCTSPPGSKCIADRIISDWSFDRQCIKNRENKIREKNYGNR